MRSRLAGVVTWERVVIGIALFAVVVSILRSQDTLVRVVEAHTRLVLAYLAALAVGELARVRLPSGREAAPVATASAIALAFTALLNGEDPFATRASVLILVATAGLGSGLLIRRVLGRDVRLYLAAARLLGAGVVGLLARAFEIGGTSLWELQVDLQTTTPLVATAMLAIAFVGVLIEVVLGGLVRAQRGRANWAAVLRDDIAEAPALNGALVAAGPLVALLAPALGLAALPLALFPMMLTYIAVNRYVANQRTYREMIATLSRLTEAGGYTTPRHAERVAELSVAMARTIGLLQRDVADLEYAALLHDLGQIALREPIPGGATVLAAPTDQQHIAQDGARIVRHAGVLDRVADLIEVQATPYRQVRELGEDVPVGSRIIKVANAFDDLTGGRRRRDIVDRAVERIHLGLGYEYDPAIVDALIAVLARPRASARTAAPTQPHPAAEAF